MNELSDSSDIAGVEESTTLDKLQINRKAKVTAVNTDNSEIQCRLLTLGLYPGVQIEVLRSAPMGDPLQIRSGTTLMSMRKHEAQSVEVIFSHD